MAITLERFDPRHEPYAKAEVVGEAVTITRDQRSKITLIIDGASSAELVAIADAINAPIERMRSEAEHLHRSAAIDAMRARLAGPEPSASVAARMAE